MLMTSIWIDLILLLASLKFAMAGAIVQPLAVVC
jgi:hypothetical protein